jgi:hypothetical protein
MNPSNPPRRVANTGFASGNMTAAGSQNSNPPKRAATGSVNEPVKRDSGLDSGNLPFKRQPASSQSQFRGSNNGSGGNPKGVD